MRKQLRRWLRELHDALHVTSLFVTHDLDEALEVADQVVVMHAGRIEQQGTPRAICEQPATPFVREFLDGAVLSPEPLVRARGGLRIDGGEPRPALSM